MAKNYYPGGSAPGDSDLADVAAVVRSRLVLNRASINATPVNRMLAIYGDSISAAANQIGTNIQRRANIGYGTFVPILSKQRVHFPFANNFGVSGDTTAQMLTRLQTVLDAKPAVCVVHGGTNDTAGAGIPAADTIANLKTIYDAFNRAGIIVIAVPILGRNAPNGWAAQSNIDKAHAVNAYIRRQRYLRPNFFVADCGLVFDDIASATFTNLGFTQDGLHPDPRGCYIIAKQIVAIVNALYPDADLPVVQASDLWSTNDLTGNLISNGVMAGTGGSVSGGTTGVTATGWGCSATGAGGATVTASKSTFTDGRAAQRLVLSGNYAATAGLLAPSISITGAALASLAAGDVLEAKCEYAIAGGQQNIAAIGLTLNATQGGAQYSQQDGWGNPGFRFPTESHGGILRTPSIKLTQNVTAASVAVWVQLVNVGSTSSPVTADILFGSVSVRKVMN